MKYSNTIKQVSKELNISEEVVEEAYKSFFAFIKEVITTLPLKEDLSEEEFNNLKTNFNIPALGKLHCTYDRYVRVKKKKKILENERKKD